MITRMILGLGSLIAIAMGVGATDFANLGLSFQRSQTSGRRCTALGDVYGYYERLESHVDAPDREEEG